MKQGKHAKGNTTKMNRRIFALIASGAICAALVTGGSLAYFNASEHTHNVITSGGIDIKLNEWADLNRETPFEDVEGIMPGESVVKVVEVKNTGASPAWVRIDANKIINLATGVQGDADVATIDFNTEYWTQGEDGYWYYKDILASGEVTKPLFTEVNFNGPGMGNEYQGSSLVIDIKAYAVQSDNNSNSALTASGWPAV